MLCVLKKKGCNKLEEKLKLLRMQHRDKETGNMKKRLVAM